MPGIRVHTDTDQASRYEGKPLSEKRNCDPDARPTVEHGILEPAEEVGFRDSIPADDLDQEPPVTDSPPPADDDIPDNFDNLMFLSPEQYEALLKARAEQQHDLSREQVEALLGALEEQARQHPDPAVVEHGG